ncbi:MAG: uracil-DNA glycosylase [Flavobacteriaceae bacterium]|nr:uracil-DNA glycosylase [Flavobacteriaceae bacterium]
MDLIIHKSWEEVFKNEIENEYFKSLISFVESQYQTRTCYPPKKLIFNAFKICSFDSLKVVILGQDPYHGNNQADGLSFSVSNSSKHPSSLVNIFKELKDDLKKDYPISGNLNCWAIQGVLLLNSTMTVEKNKAGSHQNKGWEIFTDQIIKYISDNKQNVVFILWGNYSKNKTKLINASKHLVLTSGHPSPLSANRGYWFGNKHFSKANKYLTSHNKQTIEW